MLPRDCQMLLFSATFEDSVWKFARKVVPDPNIIKLKREEETLDTIKQYYVLCSSREEKFHALCNIYGAITIAQAMIFCHVSAGAAGTPLLPRSRVPSWRGKLSPTTATASVPAFPTPAPLRRIQRLKGLAGGENRLPFSVNFHSSLSAKSP